MTHDVYEIGDFLTLYANAHRFPEGFIGIGTRPSKVWCLTSLMEDDKVNSEVIAAARRLHRKQSLVLFPDKAAAYAVFWDQADPVCAGCGLAILEHP